MRMTETGCREGTRKKLMKGILRFRALEKLAKSLMMMQTQVGSLTTLFFSLPIRSTVPHTCIVVV